MRGLLNHPQLSQSAAVKLEVKTYLLGGGGSESSSYRSIVERERERERERE